MPNSVANAPAIKTAVATSRRIRFDWKTASAAFLLTVLVAGFFWPTVFHGTPVSKFALLGEVDSLYNRAFKASNGWCGVDPSTYCLAIPIETVVRNSFRNGHLPLWNPLNGCGYPLIADPQSFVFSPLYWLFPADHWRAYNLSIVLKPLAAAFGVFALARMLGLSRFASCFGALAFAFCPYFLRYEELPLQLSLFPWLFLPFLWLCQRQTLPPIIAAGITCALFFSFTHPEPLFYGVALASVFCIARQAWQTRLNPGAMLKMAGCLSGAAAIAICFSAPTLLPFIEYLFHGSCYKAVADNLSARPVSWFTLFFNLLNPAFGGAYACDPAGMKGVGSPFLGILVPLFLPIALLVKSRCNGGLLVTAVAAFLFLTHLGPAAVLDIKPFCYAMPVYALPPFILCLCLLSADGFQHVIGAGSRGFGRLTTLALLASAAVCVLLPLALAISGVSLADNTLDGSMKAMQVDLASWLSNCILLAAATGVLLLRNYLRPCLVALILLTLNVCSQLCAAADVLPRQQNFPNRVPGCLKIVQKSGERMLAMGGHLLMPNTNGLYGVNDLAFDNPMTIDGYEKLIGAAGATRRALYMWDFNGRPNRVIDACSVRYLLSQGPLVASDEAAVSYADVAQLKEAPLVVEPGLRLEAAQMAYDPADNAVHGLLTWKVHARVGAVYVMEPVLMDTAGNRLWWGTRKPLIGKLADRHVQLQTLEVAVNRRIPAGTPLIAGVRLWTALPSGVHSLNPQYSPIKLIGQTIPLLFFSKQTARAADATRHLKLVLQEGEQLRLYENTKALPRAYVVHNSIPAPSRDVALKLLTSATFDPSATVIVECGAQLLPGMAFSHRDDSEISAVYRDGPNQVEVRTNLHAPGILVLTDAFYPGWRASIDGRQTPILRANYFFRAVVLPSGKHTVRFAYVPLPFWAGVLLFFTAALGSVGLLALAHKANKERRVIYE